MTWPITAEDVRAELGGTWVTSAPDEGAEDELTVYANSACERIEAEIGPRRGQTFSQSVRGPATAVVLDWPAESITIVTAGGTPLPLPADAHQPGSAVVHGPFPRGLVTVTAVAPEGVPDVVSLAARYLAATWVKQSKVGPPSARTRGNDPDGDVLQGFAMPRRVSEMIRPYVIQGGFA